MQEGGHLSAHFLPDLSLSQSTALLRRHQLQKPFFLGQQAASVCFTEIFYLSVQVSSSRAHG